MELRHRPSRFINRFVASLLALILSFSAVNAYAEPFSEYDLLLLDFTLERERLAQSVTAYTVNNTIVISLAEAAAALEFPISVDAANGTAKGWFLNKERDFELNIKAGTVTVEGKTTALTPGDAMVHEDAIYVPLEAFSRWFPATLIPELTKMTVEVEAREPLPIQNRAERRKFAGSRFVMTPPSLPELELPYRLVGPHTTDLGLGYNIHRNTKSGDSSANTSLTHSMLIRGELAYMSSAIYLNGNDTKLINQARLTLSRDRPNTPAGISRIEIGDISPSVLSGAPQADIERGVLIKNSTFQDAHLYNIDGTKTNIKGDILPGWEVELLHNGIRVDYQVIGPQGLYDFRDLDLYSGANIFELIFYGPAGEKRSEIITRYAGADTIRKGNLSYQLTASQKGESLYDAALSANTQPTDRGTGRYTARLDYGLFSNLAIRSGWNSAIENGERLNYLSAGFRTGWRDFYLTLDATRDPLGGTIWDGVINTPFTMRLWGFNTQLQHTQYANSIIATDSTSTLQVSSRSGVVLTRATSNFSSRFAATHEKHPTSSTTIYSADLSANRRSHRIGNTINYQNFDNPTTPNQSTLFTGNLYFTSKLDPLDVRGNVIYRLQPQNEALQYQLKINLRVAQDMGMYFGADYAPPTQLTLYTAGMNWQLKYVSLSPRLSYDSNGNYNGFIYATTSLSPRPDRTGILLSSQPMANNGGVAGRVFFDRDNNGVFSEGDTPIANTEIYASQAFRHAPTDQEGTAYLTALYPGKATDIRLDQGTLPDIAMISSHPGNSVRPRAARWALIDFPVIASGEIDGTLYQRHDDNLTPLSGILVELRDPNNEVVAFKITGHDGFFLFEQIPYGRYTLTLAEETRGRLTSPPVEVQLNQQTPAQQGVELIVASTQAAPPTLFPSLHSTATTPTVQKTAPPQPALETPPTAPTQTLLTPYMLQLGAFGSQASAEAAVTKLRQAHNKLLEQLTIQIERTDLGTRGVFYRIYAKGNIDADQASTRCNQLKERGQNCFVVIQKDLTTP